MIHTNTHTHAHTHTHIFMKTDGNLAEVIRKQKYLNYGLFKSVTCRFM